MRNIVFTLALICAVVLAPMVAVANQPDGSAPAPDFRALAFDGGMTSDAQVEAPVRTKMDSIGRTFVGGAVGAVLGAALCFVADGIGIEKTVENDDGEIEKVPDFGFHDFGRPGDPGDGHATWNRTGRNLGCGIMAGGIGAWIANR